MKIGELARTAGVNVETIRYYQRIGLMGTPESSSSGYRKYGSEELEALVSIRKAKALGFTLTEIRQLEELKRSPGCCEAVCGITNGVLERVRSKILELQELEQTLSTLLSHQSREAKCVILNSLEG